MASLTPLTDPVTSFAWLDAYEGLLAGRGDNDYDMFNGGHGRWRRRR